MWTLETEKRRRFVQGMTRLSVWYVRRLLETGEVRPGDVARALCKRVDLYRLTDLWDGVSEKEGGLLDPEWTALASEIASWIQATPMKDVGNLEQRVLEFLGPSLERRLPQDVGPPPVRPFECWTYELGWAGLGDRRGLWGRLSNPVHLWALFRKSVNLSAQPSRDAVLHIMNVVTPRSPFDDMARLAATLHALIAELRRVHPQVSELWCNTWLNDHERFRAIFPQKWFDSAAVAPPGNHRNWWGQFAKRDGDFRQKAAQQFREAGGVFPYRALRCHAGLSDLEAHLERNFDLRGEGS